MLWQLYTNKKNTHEEFLLGYIPKNENEVIAPMLEMGWSNIFSCIISKINADAHYENQIRLTIHIVRNTTQAPEKK